MRQLSIFKLLAFLTILSGFMIQCKTGEKEISKDIFVNPSKEYRPMALWPWLNDFVDTSKMVYELDQMKDKGMRGAIIWDIGSLSDPNKLIPDGPPFLGHESLNNISLALNTAKSLIWIWDGHFQQLECRWTVDRQSGCQ